MNIEIEVVHLKRCPHCFPVDRRTWLGNPFHLQDEGDRAAVVAAHKRYLWMLINPQVAPIEPADAAQFLVLRNPKLAISPSWQRPTRTEFMRALNMLQAAAREDNALQLGCWCAPKPCHADNYKKLLLWRSTCGTESAVSEPILK